MVEELRTGNINHGGINLLTSKKDSANYACGYRLLKDLFTVSLRKSLP